MGIKIHCKTTVVRVEPTGSHLAFTSTPRAKGLRELLYPCVIAWGHSLTSSFCRAILARNIWSRILLPKFSFKFYHFLLCNLTVFLQYYFFRYISRSYYHAYSAVQPDQVIFLGDLIDEMVFATDEEIQDTFKRFRSVFPVYDSKTTVSLYYYNIVFKRFMQNFALLVTYFTFFQKFCNKVKVYLCKLL